jgi:anti-sigma factor RsiW
MNRVDELTLGLVDGELGPAEELELRALLADPALRARHAKLVRLEAAFRAERREIGAAAPVMERILDARRERVVDGVLRQLPVRRAPRARWRLQPVWLAAAAAVALLVWAVRRPDAPVPAVAPAPFAVVTEGQGALAPGRVLAPGARAETHDRGATLRYRGHTTLTVGPRTQLTLEDPARSGGRRANLEAQVVHVAAGTVRAEVGHQPVERVLIFLTPHARVTVVGTVLSIFVTPIETTLEVLEGRVLFERLSADSIEEVRGGQRAAAAGAIAVEPPPVADDGEPKVVFHYDFEDGQQPARFRQGAVMTGPCRPGSRYCAIGMLDPYDWTQFAVALIGAPALAHYSEDLVLSFDYWAGKESPQILVQLWNPDRGQNFYASLPNKEPETWSHAEIRLEEALGERQLPWVPGDVINNIRILAGRAGAHPFYVDDLRLVLRPRSKGGRP